MSHKCMQKINKINANKSTSSIIFQTYNLLKHYYKDIFDFSQHIHNVVQINMIGKYYNYCHFMIMTWVCYLKLGYVHILQIWDIILLVTLKLLMACPKFHHKSLGNKGVFTVMDFDIYFSKPYIILSHLISLWAYFC